MGEEKMIIEHSTYINCPVEKVYTVLTTAKGWDSWFTTGTEIDLRMDGYIKLRWVNFGPFSITTEDGGRIIEVEKNKKFTFQWKPGETITNVSFKVEHLKSGTLVTVKEYGYSNSDRDSKACLDCATGWGEALTLLKFYLEHGITYGDIN